jgi:ferredoxin/flavodoxin---NADP+ reductase
MGSDLSTTHPNPVRPNPVPPNPVPPAVAVAVVGSGPSGCYVAQMLRKQWPLAEITVFDRLPVPFGLLRYGVAPDHQHTKQLAHQFGRVFADERTRFAGNVEVGGELSVDELRQSYHVVVLAAGLSGDRQLDVPGASLARVYGAGQVMRWVNAHPDETAFRPSLGGRTVIVGNGNVAVDVLRMLAKTAEQLDETDIAEQALDGLKASPTLRVDVVGRSAASNAKFDAAMIRELSSLEGVRFEIEDFDAEELPSDAMAKVDAIRQLGVLERLESSLTVAFHFGWTPAEIHGGEQVEAMSFTRTDGTVQVMRLPADSVVSAIGFTDHPTSSLRELSAASGDGGPDRRRLDRGLYSCGWFRRGATGSIPDNRACAKDVVAAIVADVDRGSLGAKPGYDGLPPDVRGRAVDFDGWRRIDAAETAARADAGRVRHKIGDRSALLSIAHGNDPAQE